MADNKKLNDILSKIDPKTLNKSLSGLNALLNSKDGDKIKKQFENIDKNSLLASLNNLDADTINKKLSNLDVKDLAKSPNLAEKLKDIIEKKD